MSTAPTRGSVRPTHATEHFEAITITHLTMVVSDSLSLGYFGAIFSIYLIASFAFNQG